MKLHNYILSAATLIAGAFAFASCQMEEPVQDPQISTDKAVYEATPESGSVTIKLVSNDTWTATISPASSRDNVDDFTLSAKEGDANVKEVVVSFGENAGFNRAALVTFNGRNTSAAVKIEQKGVQGELMEELTIAEFNAKPVDASIYYIISGTVTRIAQSNKYSNFYLNDGTAEVYIYGLYDGKGGPQFTDGLLDRLGIQVGYTMTIGATRGVYGSTIEGLNAYVISYAPPTTPMLSVEVPSVSVDADATEATFAISAMNLKSDWTVTAAENYDWITDYTKSGREAGEVKISFTANEDTENARVAKFTLANADCDPVELTLTQGKKLTAGTQETPFTVAEATAYCQTLENKTTSSSQFYVKGKISKIQSVYDAKYGTAIYWISDDGTFFDDKTKDFEIYSSYWFDNKSWTEGSSNIALGDEVVVVGNFTNYNGTLETASKKSYLYSLNGFTEDTPGMNITSPLSIKQAVELCSALSAPTPLDYYVTGVVCELTKYQFGPTFNTASFWLSDDGTTTGAKFEAYNIYYLNNPGHESGVAFPEDGKLIALGQKIVLRGQLTQYKETSETSSKKAHIVSIQDPEAQPGEGEGEEEEEQASVLYTLDSTLESSKTEHTDYKTSGDVTINGLAWSVCGNLSLNPWRIGGKSIENTDREVYTKTPFEKAVGSIVFTAGNISSDLKLNSAKLLYSTSEDFSEAKEVSFTPEANKAVEIKVDGGFPENAYYKFVFNVTVTESANRYIQFSKVEFKK